MLGRIRPTLAPKEFYPSGLYYLRMTICFDCGRPPVGVLMFVA